MGQVGLVGQVDLVGLVGHVELVGLVSLVVLPTLITAQQCPAQMPRDKQVRKYGTWDARGPFSPQAYSLSSSNKQTEHTN